MARTSPLVYHVTYEPAGWCLWLAGSAQTAEHFARKEDAVRAGQRHARSSPPSQLRVHAADGSLEVCKHFYGEGAPAEGDSEAARSTYALGRGAVAPEEL